MKIGIIQLPGTHSERAMGVAMQYAGMESVEFLWGQEADTLRALDGYLIVNGPVEDGAVRAELGASHHSVMSELAQQSEQGKPVLGLGAGVQVLVMMGLVPGLENNKVGMAFDEKKRTDHPLQDAGVDRAWTYMRLSDHFQRNAFTRHLSSKDVLQVPTAQNEGRFVIPSALLYEMKIQGLNVFQYCNEQGEIAEHGVLSLSGSVDNIAAVSNKNGNVMAMIPHVKDVTNGAAILRSMRDYIACGRKERCAPLSYYPRKVVTATRQSNDSVVV